MTPTMCAFALAAASIIGAIFAAQKRTSSQLEQVVITPRTTTDTTKECLVLIEILKAELQRMHNASTPDAKTLVMVVTAFKDLFELAWPHGTYYYPTNISPFLKVLVASVNLQSEKINPNYILTVSRTIETLAPDCVNAITRGENGDQVTDFTYKCMEQIRYETRLLEKFINLPENSHFAGGSGR